MTDPRASGDRPPPAARPRRLLAVRDPALAALAGRHRPVPTVGFAELTPGLLDRDRPAAVAFALLAEGHDAFQVLGRLERIGFAGRVLALAPGLPSRRMVERELRAQAPGLRIRVLCLPSLSDGG